jgi:anti-repressor protein
MKELINITENNGIQVVSARELYKGLEISKRFSAWFKMNAKNFEESQDFTSVPSSTVVNNGATIEIEDFALTLDMAKNVCLMSSTEKGKEYRKYLIELNNKQHETAIKRI